MVLFSYGSGKPQNRVFRKGNHRLGRYLPIKKDAYSRRIVGYYLAESLEAVASIKAMQMALFALGAESHLNLIHRSDRGLQYCTTAYAKLLLDSGIQISMTESSDPLENAVSERVNGI